MQLVTPQQTLRALLLVLLSAAILAWGTAYKCSLYKSSAEQSKTAVAKLDTRISDVAKADLDTSLTHKEVLEAFAFALPLALPERVFLPLREDVRPDFALRLRRTPCLSLRPPPIHTLASI